MPLTTWAEGLAATLDKCRCSSRMARDFAGEVAGIANKAALIAAYQGIPALARMLCEQQVRWQSRLGRRARDAEIAFYAIQPWVNLARLEALSGDCPAALARLSRLRLHRPGEPLALDCLRIPAVGAEANASCGAFDRLLQTMYVIDSLKALLLNGMYGEVRTFVEGLDPDTPAALLRFASEASTIAACRLSDFERARRTAVTAWQHTRGWERAVFRLRLAEVLACESDEGGASAILVQLAGVLGQVSPVKRAELTSLYIMLRVCTACAEAGLTREAVATARNVHKGARAAGDEVFEIESLRILADMDTAPEREQWREALDELEETTDYLKYRRGDRKPVRKPSIDRLYEMLTETLSN